MLMILCINISAQFVLTAFTTGNIVLLNPTIDSLLSLDLNNCIGATTI